MLFICCVWGSLVAGTDVMGGYEAMFGGLRYIQNCSESFEADHDSNIGDAVSVI